MHLFPYFLGCRNRNRRRNSFVRKCCYSNLPVWVGKIRIATISNQTASTCISVSTPSSDTYSYQILQFCNVIFSSFVSVHIMVYNCASVFIFFGGAEIEIEEEIVLFENVAIRIFPCGLGRFE